MKISRVSSPSRGPISPTRIWDQPPSPGVIGCTNSSVRPNRSPTRPAGRTRLWPAIQTANSRWGTALDPEKIRGGKIRPCEPPSPRPKRDPLRVLVEQGKTHRVKRGNGPRSKTAPPRSPLAAQGKRLFRQLPGLHFQCSQENYFRSETRKR